MSDPTKAEIKQQLSEAYLSIESVIDKLGFNSKRLKEDLKNQQKFIQSQIDSILKDNGHRKLK